MKTITTIMLLLCATVASAAPHQRSDDGPRGGHERRNGPPREALEVCKGKADGTAVEMKTPRGDMVKGTCRSVMMPDRRERD